MQLLREAPSLFLCLYIRFCHAPGPPAFCSLTNSRKKIKLEYRLLHR